jgi:hypothetical protein
MKIHLHILGDQWPCDLFACSPESKTNVHQSQIFNMFNLSHKSHRFRYIGAPFIWDIQSLTVSCMLNTSICFAFFYTHILEHILRLDL